MRERGWFVWFDEFELRLGDSLRRKIDRGLAESRFGLVILSPSFFAKEWPQRELDGLTAREVGSADTIILPIWHDVDREYVASFSPVLADRLAAPSHLGVDAIVNRVESVLGLRPVAPAQVALPADQSSDILARRPVASAQHGGESTNLLPDPSSPTDSPGSPNDTREGEQSAGLSRTRQDSRAATTRWFVRDDVAKWQRRLAKAESRGGYVDDAAIEALREIIKARRARERGDAGSDELLADLRDLAGRLANRLSPDSPETIETRRALAKTLSLRGDRDAAIVELQELLGDLGNRRYRKGREDIEAGNELASLLEARGGYADAALYHQANARQLERLDGGTAETTVAARKASARAFARAELWDEAILEDKLRVSAFARDSDSDQQQHFNAREDLVRHLLAAGRWDDATRTLEQSLRVLESRGELTDRVPERVACALENLYSTDGKFEMAASVWRTLVEAAGEQDDSPLAGVHAKYAAALARAGAHANAVAVRTRILDAAKRRDDPDGQRRAWLAVCEAHEAAGDRASALTELEALLDSLPTGSVEAEIHRLDVEERLALISAADDRQSSIRRLQRISDDYERLVGPQSLEAFEARARLGLVLGWADEWERSTTVHRGLIRDVRRAIDDGALRADDLELEVWAGYATAMEHSGDATSLIRELRAFMQEVRSQRRLGDSQARRLRTVLIRSLMNQSLWQEARVEFEGQLEDLAATRAGPVANLTVRTHIAWCVGKAGDWETASHDLEDVEHASAELASVGNKAPTRDVFRWSPLTNGQPLESESTIARELEQSTRLRRAIAIFESGARTDALCLVERTWASTNELLGRTHPATLGAWETWISLLQRDDQWAAAAKEWETLIEALEVSAWYADDAVLKARGYAAWAHGEAGDWNRAIAELTDVASAMASRYGPFAGTAVGVGRSLAKARERAVARSDEA